MFFCCMIYFFFFFSSRRRHTRLQGDWSSDVCSSDLDNLEYRQVVSLAQAALRERLTGAERARAYELLGFTYGALDSILRAVDAFKQVVLIDPERQLDPNRVSPKAYSAFDVALRQVLLG